MKKWTELFGIIDTQQLNKSFWLVLTLALLSVPGCSLLPNNTSELPTHIMTTGALGAEVVQDFARSYTFDFDALVTVTSGNVEVSFDGVIWEKPASRKIQVAQGVVLWLRPADDAASTEFTVLVEQQY